MGKEDATVVQPAVERLVADEIPVVATFHTSIERSRALTVSYPFLRPAMEKISAPWVVPMIWRQRAGWPARGCWLIVGSGPRGGHHPTVAARSALGNGETGLWHAGIGVQIYLLIFERAP